MQEQPLDPKVFRQTIGRFATGVTIITARHGDLIHGMTANAVSSLSIDPLLILICIDRRAKMLDVISNASHFAVNVLSDHQESLSRHFSGAGHGAPPPPELRFEDGDGPPLIAGALARLTCTLDAVLPGGDHLIFTGKVLDCYMAEDHVKPLLFFKGRYHHLQSPDVASHKASEPWLNDSVSVYHEDWPDPLLRVLAGDELLP